MTLSKKFFVRAQAVANASDSPSKPAWWEPSIEAAAKPVIDLCERLRHLPRGRDGNSFSYTIVRTPIAKLQSLAISGTYSPPRKHAQPGPTAEEVRNSFYLMIRKDPDDGGYSFIGSEPDGNGTMGQSFSARDAQTTIDVFFADWIGRVMPEAVQQLAKQEENRTRWSRIDAKIARFLAKHRHP